jgi:formylglycine-generating enzyme
MTWRSGGQGKQLSWALLVPALLTSGCDASGSLPFVPKASASPMGSPPPRAVASIEPPPQCPEGMVLVDSYCIDRFEAHVVRLDGAPHSPYHPLEEGVSYRARSGSGVIPQGYISRNEAARSCELAGKRLCKASEWQRACKGRKAFKYPYGKDEVRGRCNTRKQHLPAKLFGQQLSGYGPQHLNDPRLNREPGFLAETGAYADCVSDYGIFDLVGNLHEWVADDVNSALPKKIPIPYGAHNMGKRGNGVFMGGYFSSQREHGRGCEYVTTHHAPGYHDYSTGFRCCAEPDQ